MCQGESKANRGSVIENVNCESINTDSLCEPVDDLRQIVKGVSEFFTVGRVGKAEPREIRRNHMVLIRKRRNEIAKHVRRGGETVQQQDRGTIFGTCFPIKDLGTVDDGVLVSGHDEPPWDLEASNIVDQASPSRASIRSDCLTDKRLHYRCYYFEKG